MSQYASAVVISISKINSYDF